MPPFSSARSRRQILVTLVVSIVGVLALDTTAIVASPRDTSSTATLGVLNHTEPTLRLQPWSGETWLVFPNSANGPDGPRTLSDSTQAVNVDSAGRLHLRITKVNGKRRGVQLEALNPLNYGTYRFVLGSPVGDLATSLVLGMFVYKASQYKYTNEIDLENSRSLIGLGYPRDAQYVVQPYYKANHIRRYAVRRKYKTVTEQFTWQPGHVSFVTRTGSGKQLGHFSFSGPDVPVPGNEHLYINLHFHGKKSFTDGRRTMILNSFTRTGP
jgi:hypothetical protein